MSAAATSPSVQRESEMRKPQEVFGRDQIPFGRKHEIDGVARGIDSSVQVHSFPAEPNVGLV
jgi:hypothetical protein